MRKKEEKKEEALEKKHIFAKSWDEFVQCCFFFLRQDSLKAFKIFVLFSITSKYDKIA